MEIMLPHQLYAPRPYLVSFPQPLYYLTSNYYCFYACDTLLQPMVYYFHPCLGSSQSHGVDQKNTVVIEELESHGGSEEETEASVENLSHGENMGFSRSLGFGGAEDDLDASEYCRRGPRMRLSRRLVGGGHGGGHGGVHGRVHGRDGKRKQVWIPVSKNTTVMLKNVPNKFWKEGLMEFLDNCCRVHDMAYDFLYLPIDFKTHFNLGYAFVNFTTPGAAAKCKEVLQNFEWARIFYETKKVCEVTWARIQGKEALERHFNKSNFVCDTIDYLPVVFNPPRNGFNSGSQRIVGHLWG